MAIEVPSHEFVNLCLARGVQILELVHGLELDHIKSIRQYSVRFPLEQMLTLICGDVGNGGKDICAMGSRSLDAVTVVDTAFARFVIDIKVLEVIVEIHRASTKVSPKKGSMGRKDRGHVNMTLTAQRNGQSGLPFMKMGYNCCMQLARDILRAIISAGLSIRRS